MGVDHTVSWICREFLVRDCSLQPARKGSPVKHPESFRIAHGFIRGRIYLTPSDLKRPRKAETLYVYNSFYLESILNAAYKSNSDFSCQAPLYPTYFSIIFGASALLRILKPL